MGRKHFPTVTEKASFQLKGSRLHRRMQMLLEVQNVYIPGVASLEADPRTRMAASHDASGILFFIHCYA